MTDLERAEADWAAVRGREAYVSHVQGYVGDDSVDVYLRRPVLVRFRDVPFSQVQDSGGGGWTDPLWDFEILEPSPELPAGLRSPYCYGTSYGPGGVVELARVTLVDEWPGLIVLFLFVPSVVLAAGLLLAFYW